MLEPILIAAAAIIVPLILFVGWRHIATIRSGSRLRDQLMAELEPVWKPIYAGTEPNASDLLRFASDPRLRNMLFDLLLVHHMLHLFSKQYRTSVHLAESQLVGWLMHPNELGSPPDELEFSEEVILTDSRNRRQSWLLFRFRTHPPHWAARDAWMAGVVGPVPSSDEEMFPDAPVVWSLFRGFDTGTPREHVTACRELAQRSGVKV